MDKHAVHRYFVSLRGLSFASRAQQRFGEIIAGEDAPTPAEFFPRLYRALVDFLLQSMDLNPSLGAEYWEWQPLYKLHREINHGYFTGREIAACLDTCPRVPEETRELISDVLTGYFTLRREGFPKGYPSRLVSMEDTARWCNLFPGKLAWRAGNVLRRVGLYPVASEGGWRSLCRYAEGRFDPDYTTHGLYRWQAACRDAMAADRTPADGGAPADSVPAANSVTAADGNEQAEARQIHQLDFLAAVFAGEFATLGLPGPCGAMPRCESCALREGCQWHSQPAGEAYMPGAIIARLSGGPPDDLTTTQLLDAVISGGGDTPLPPLGSQTEIPGLRAMAGLSAQEIEAQIAIGDTARSKLSAVLELCRRFNGERLQPGSRLPTGQDVFEHFRVRLRDMKQEQFLVVLLDVSRRTLGEVLVTQGLLDKSLVHPREVFHEAIRQQAASVILVHNHPSGNPDPSQADFEATRVLIEAGRLVGITVIDHVIVAENGYTSFAESNLMNF